jgi:ribosomal protein S6--L-glutamate ligase
MLIYILSRNENLYSTARLIEAGRKAGHIIEVYNHMFCDLLIEEGEFSINYNEKALNKPDYIIPRIGANVTKQGEKVIRHFEKMGVLTLTSSDGLLNSRNKFRSMQILAESKLNMPLTYFSNDFEYAEQIVESKLGYPFILKITEGTQGVGVYLIKDKQQSQRFFDHYSESSTQVILQKFISESKGRDIRIFTVGENVIASMERIAPPDEFRSNIHQGGTGINVSLSPNEIDLAVKAIKALDLKIGGVDIIRSKKGPLILEVNSSPGLEGIEGTTKIDIATSIFKFIEADFEETQKKTL